MSRFLVLISLILAGCHTAVTPWKFDAIASDSEVFRFAKLTYQDPQSPNPLIPEWVRVGEAVSFYLSLTQYCFHKDPSALPQVLVQFSADNALLFEEKAPLLEGNMRLPISEEGKTQVIQALQQGKQVAILVDDFEVILEPEYFSSVYEKL